VKRAVEHGRLLSWRGLQDRLFTLAFSGLVYAQIWEDPAIDMEALALKPTDRIVAIASGGCNVLSYLLADPAAVTAVDLNRHHVALNRLKLAAARTLTDHASFYSLFGRGRGRNNLDLYRMRLRPALDPDTRAYWDGRDSWGFRRSGYLARGLHRHGLLGRFIAAGHAVARLGGADLGAVLRAKDVAGQREAFERHIAPLFDRPLVRWLSRRRAALYGLGIPPAQYDALAADGGTGGIVAVLRARTARLACDFDVRHNYFAWAAFARGYKPEGDGPVPPYLERSAFPLLRGRAERVSVRHVNMIDHLRGEPAASLDAYVLLDAQDWMDDATLEALWREITRTARAGARVIFRTAATETLLPGRLPDALLSRWSYDRERCRAWTARDRSAIYGGFHLYTLLP
jgi:S-adenosylmethionine-diacylglycerol 3-amino-3-carboxypropyl transferase